VTGVGAVWALVAWVVLSFALAAVWALTCEWRRR
jgi:hypothetical protein